MHLQMYITLLCLQAHGLYKIGHIVKKYDIIKSTNEQLDILMYVRILNDSAINWTYYYKF